ncbi:MAG: imidazole glycerol phosphate synthase subunit HisH [Saccharofermentans sp.]|nr:imidazole glycerol phosphate synthase subunit HisH [Saccharofermentans sp.]
MIAIVDYKMGNLASVRKALEYMHRECVITDDPALISGADALILPGVGAYAPAMSALKEKGLDVVVNEFAATGKPMLGICLGMQLMLSESEEGAVDGNIKGLGIIPGTVRKFPSDKTVDQGLKVPQMGWNKLTDVKGSLLRNGDYVYFVHSFYCDPEDEADAAAYTEYGIKYVCALEHGNIFATQFHPEKSGEAGLQILERFARRIKT